MSSDVIPVLSEVDVTGVPFCIDMSSEIVTLLIIVVPDVPFVIRVSLESNELSVCVDIPSGNDYCKLDWNSCISKSKSKDTKKYPLCYILDVLAHTNTLEQHWGGDEDLGVSFDKHGSASPCLKSSCT